MNKGIFRDVAAFESNEKWNDLIKRESDLYSRYDDVRSPFARDYTRILHSLAYRRLKHKTQVFFNIDNDHICTRMEHVAHVESVSNTIAKYLGLNNELTKAIAIGHDLGHAPFGHQGERVLKKLTEEHMGQNFWHEKNGLRFVDDVELLEDNYKVFQNLDLTYAVRDGIISHCGEVDENGLKPRDELIDLNDFNAPGEYQAATWEGCVVKISDKIAYIGRDIEDAILLGFLNEQEKNILSKMARIYDQKAVNTTVIIHNLIIDICKNSSPEKGICLSQDFFKQMNEIKQFNYEYIYNHERLQAFKRYSELVITTIFETLFKIYDKNHTFGRLRDIESTSSTLANNFAEFLAQYCKAEIVPQGDLQKAALRCENKKIYNDLEDKNLYVQAILDYISGMTDRFAIKIFDEMLSY